MKKLYKIIVLSLLFLLTVFVAVIESGPGQRAMQKKLIEALSQSGIRIKAEKFSGELPKTLDLTQAEIRYGDTTIQVDHLYVQIALFPLLQKKISVETFRAEGLHLGNLELDLQGELQIAQSGKASIDLEINGPLKAHLWAKGTLDHFTGKAHGSYEELTFAADLSKKEDNTIAFSEIEASIHDIHIQGNGTFDLATQSTKANLELRTTIGGEPLIAPNSITGQWQGSSFEGTIHTLGQFLQTNWTLDSSISFNPTKGLGLSNIQLQSSFAEASGTVFWKNQLSGQLDTLLDLSILSKHTLSGQLATNIDFDQALFASNLSGPLSTAQIKGHWQSNQFTLDEASGDYLGAAFQTQTASISWDEAKKVTSAHLKLALSSEEEDSLLATGALEATLQESSLRITSDLIIENEPLANLNLELPINVTLYPFKIQFPQEEPAAALLTLNGPIEELLDFFQLGMHRLAGDVTCQMALTGTLGHPELKGNCKIENGYYENYLTGTELTQLNAEIIGDGPTLTIASFCAKDLKKKGNLAITGHALATFPFPFHLAIDFTRMNLVQIDLIAAEVEGHLTIDGDIHSALAEGHIEMIETEITIPDKIPRTYPELQVVYKGQPHTPTPVKTLRNPYPLNLNLTIDAPDGVFIDGRGLHSEWHGQFTVGGTFTTPSAQGKLDLLNGEFVFVGRRFKLHEGALSLKGKAYEMPNLNISGTTSEKGIAITAHLSGPLNKPQITFQSSPPLPVSGILSYLLFGQDLSDVSGIQALQLAGTIATFAGEGPDILELTRKSLGVDRLQVVMTPTASGEETIALQVGKIVFPGFLVSIKQGADDSSPNIAIEVDLTHGFTFEAESEQQPAQGKFSLLWNLNY